MKAYKAMKILKQFDNEKLQGKTREEIDIIHYRLLEESDKSHIEESVFILGMKVGYLYAISSMDEV